MTTAHLRRLAFYVEEPDPGEFYWVLIESTSDTAVWTELEASAHYFPNWIEAYDAGDLALRARVSDLQRGPRRLGEDESASPVGGR